MRRQQIQPYFFVLGIALILSACFNEPNYSNTPEIKFEAIYAYKNLPAQKGVGRGRRDSIVVTISFRDGDGNLGNSIPLAKADSIRYKTNGDWGNYQIKTYRLVNKQYEEVPLAVNQTLFFPDLTKGKPKGAIEGTLDFNQTYLYGTSYRLYPVKYVIKIRDRDLNLSNTIETDTVWVPVQQ